MLLRVGTQALRFKVVPEGTSDLLGVLGLDESVGGGVATCTSATLSRLPRPLHEAAGANDSSAAGLDFLAELLQASKGSKAARAGRQKQPQRQYSI